MQQLDRRRALLALVLVGLLGLAVSSAYTNHAPLLPLLMADLGFGPAYGGLLSSAFFISAALFIVPIGALIDRHGPRPVATVALAVTVLGTLAMAAARGYGDLLALKVIVGVAAASGFVAGVRYAAVLFRGGLALVAQGLYGSAVQAGSGGVVYALPFVAGPYGWRAAYVAAAVFLAVCLTLWLLSPRVSAVQAVPSSLRAALRQPAGWIIGLIHTASYSVSIVIGTWAPTFLLGAYDLGLAPASQTGSLALLLGILARPLGGLAVGAGWLSAGGVMRLGLTLNVVGLLCLAAPARPFGVAVLGLVLLGVGSNLPYAAVFSGAAAALPHNPGAAVGLVTMISLSGITVGAPLVGWLVERTGGFAAAFAAIGIACLLTLLLTFTSVGRTAVSARLDATR